MSEPSRNHFLHSMFDVRISQADETMSARTRSERTFPRWLLHRTRLLGLENLSQLAELSGVNSATLISIVERGTLQRIDRSTRAWLARALKVPLREMESFAAGDGPPIPDWRVVDLDRPGGAASARARSPSAESCPKPIPAPRGRGVPIVGRILSSHRIVWNDTNCPESRPRLAISYPGITDLFALSVKVNLGSDASEGDFLIFRNLPSLHLSRGDIVLLTLSDGSLFGQSRVGRLTTGANGAAEMIPYGHPDSAPVPLFLETLVRAARLYARVNGDELG